MGKVNFTAIIAAVVSVGSMLSVATGHPAIGAVISDPQTATALQAVVGGVAALVSAFTAPVHVPTK
jgi:hypothetical protein